MLLLNSSGLVCENGLILSSVISVTAILGGVLALNFHASDKMLGHVICLITPIGGIVLFPVAQILHSGITAFLTIGLLPLSIVVIFSLLQFAVAIKMTQLTLWDIKGDRQMPSLGFRLMTIMLKIHERKRNPGARIQKIGITTGQTVLDFGCGIGNYSLPAARSVGKEGKVYSLDIHPRSAEVVRKRVEEAGLFNVETITSSKETGLQDDSVDVILLFDVLHMVEDKQGVLSELSRVLKPSGFLSIEVDHMSKEELKSIIDESGKFEEDRIQSGI
jgi:protein-L-isoaspartate O-methyltransferase